VRGFQSHHIGIEMIENPTSFCVFGASNRTI